MKKLFYLLLLTSLIEPLLAQSFSGYIDYTKRDQILPSPTKQENTEAPSEAIDAFLQEGPEVLFYQFRIFFTENRSLSYPLSFEEGNGKHFDSTFQVYGSLHRIDAKSLEGERLMLPVAGANVQEQRAALNSNDVEAETAASMYNELKGQYIPLDTQITILGFPCQAYYNDTSGIIFWITKELPTHLSIIFQEVEGEILEGAILKFEAPKAGYLLEATNIHLCPIDDVYMRDTPLYKVKPELLLEN